MATSVLFAVLLSATVCLADPTNIRGAATQNTTPQVTLPPYDCAPNAHSESPSHTLCSSPFVSGARREAGGCSCAGELAAARWGGYMGGSCDLRPRQKHLVSSYN
jgi:hypothetical protein